MRAIVAAHPGGPETLRMTEIPLPPHDPDRLLIRIRMAAVNFADVYRRRGIGRTALAFPLVPGTEVFGIVEKVGADARGFARGEHVTAIVEGGGYAEYVAAPPESCIRVPADMPPDQAASFAVAGLTAYHLLTTAAAARRSEPILITAAAGGVGSTAVQIARTLGLAPIVAAASTLERARTAIALGASHSVTYDALEVAGSLASITGGRGVAVALDAVGGAVRSSALASLGPLGRMVQYGNSSRAPEIVYSEGMLRARLLTIIGFSLTALREQLPKAFAQGARTVIDLIAAGPLRMEVDDVLPLERAAEAHTRLESRAVRGKLLLRV